MYLESIEIPNSDEFCKDMLPESISSLTRFLDLYMKQELLEVIDPAYYVANLDAATARQLQKEKATAQEFDYLTWARKTAHYPKVEITNKIHLAAKIVLLAFSWHYRIVMNTLNCLIMLP